MLSVMVFFSTIDTTFNVRTTYIVAIKMNGDPGDGYRIGDYVYYRREKFVEMTLEELSAAMNSPELYLHDGTKYVQHDKKRQLPAPKKFKLIRNKWVW